MKKNLFAIISICFMTAATLTGCSGNGSGDGAQRIQQVHKELKIVDPSLSGASVSSASTTVTAQLITVGSIYLEATAAPLSLPGAAMQASDVYLKNADAYISYSTRDSGSTIIKRGAVEHVKPYNCDVALTLTHTEYCLNAGGYVEFPATDMFGSFYDGTNLYAVGSTDDETFAPNFGRLYKMNMNASGDPVSIAATANLPSFAGTSVAVAGTKVLATSGTSTDSTKMGGLSVFNISDLSLVITQPLYDARSVGVYSGSNARAYVATGRLDSGTPGSLVEYKSDGTGTAVRTIASGGNTIAESKSSVQVGNTLLLASGGDAGFKVMCKATGAVLSSIPAVTVTGIPAANTVTNSVAAAPGYIFAANGEAGVYVYTFKKSSILNSSYCDGVTVALLGRLSLDSDSTYVPAELSANGVSYSPVYNLLNVLTGKLIVLASGNGGVSLLNINALSVNLNDVSDF